MDNKKLLEQKVEVNFESHPPIDDDIEGITTLLKQTILHHANCSSLSRYLINLKDVTQIIALDGLQDEEENTSDEDEADDDIYGVISFIEIKDNYSKDDYEFEARIELTKFLKDKCKHLKELYETKKEDGDNNKIKIAMIVNERYINLPPQLSLPTLKNLTKHLDEMQYTHLIFLSKILLRSRNTDTKLPSKKTKISEKSSEQELEPIIYVNPEEEIVFENCSNYCDYDVSSYCDENSTWSSTSDAKYTPHRRIMIIEYKNWPTILKNLEKELDNS